MRRPPCPNEERAPGAAGFTYIELLVASVLLGFALLGMCTMFVTGLRNVSGAGMSTMGLAASRQLMEDLRRLPPQNLPNLNNFDTDNVATLPANDPEREVARRWRYALAGAGVGWTFTSTEQARWTDLSTQADKLDGRGTITIVQRSATLTEVTLQVSVPGVWRPVRVSTVISRF